MNYLQKIPFDKLKMDKSFVDRIGVSAEAAQVVHSIVSLGRALGLSVTAEGVEDAEQHRLLRAAGCTQMQGFYFFRPLEVEQLTALLNQPLAIAVA